MLELKVIRKICILIALVGIWRVLGSVQNTFFGDNQYNLQIMEIQKEGNYIAYPFRKLIFSQPLAIVENVVEQVVGSLWLSGIGTLLIGLMNRKYWPEFLLIIFTITMGVLSRNPNTGFFIPIAFVPIIGIATDKWISRK